MAGCHVFRNNKATVPTANAVAANEIVEIAQKYMGSPYKYAGNTPKGFDCSGYVHFVFKEAGYAVPRVSRDFAAIGTEVPLEKCTKGDIVLFMDTDPAKNRIGHVGIIISEQGKKPIKFIHASSSKRNNGVVISNYSESKHYQKRFAKIVRYL